MDFREKESAYMSREYNGKWEKMHLYTASHMIGVCYIIGRRQGSSVGDRSVDILLGLQSQMNLQGLVYFFRRWGGDNRNLQMARKKSRPFIEYSP